MPDTIASMKENIIRVGKLLYNRGLAVARSGNISCRVDQHTILITATGTYLSDLSSGDIVTVRLDGLICTDAQKPSSELPLHSLVYTHMPARAVVHCHPAYINGFFSVASQLPMTTFETKFYLGEVPVVAQDTPTVTKPDAVIAALRSSNIVVLKNHGVVAIGDTFPEALSLVETLEEAVKTAAVARIFSAQACSSDKRSDTLSVPSATALPMFSQEHIQAIVDLVNKDVFIAQKGKELDLTVELTVKLDNSDKAFTFHFQKGHIDNINFDPHAPFVISAPKEIWELVFLGKLDSFVAVTQGKMKLQGQLGQLSKWYVPFTRLFELFKQVSFTAV